MTVTSKKCLIFSPFIQSFNKELASLTTKYVRMKIGLVTKCHNNWLCYLK